MMVLFCHRILRSKPVRKRYEADISPVSEWLTVTAVPPAAQMLKGGACRSLPPLPIIDRASICPCPIGKADPALAHVPLVKALRYLAYPCCLRSGLRMEVFGLCPTFHVSVPLLVFSSEWLAGSLCPPSRKPPPPLLELSYMYP